MVKITPDSVIFNLHIMVFMSLILLFFIPIAIWPERIFFHFWYITITIASEVLTGLILFPYMKASGHNYRTVCPLTTWMQCVRGYSIKNPKNFNHGFVFELGKKFNITVPKGTVVIINILIFIFAGWQYFT